MMKFKFKSFAFLFCALLWSGYSRAQESSNSSGGSAIGAGGSVEYSVGQIVYTTDTGNSGSISQGIQHAYEIFTIGISELESSNSLVAFPNPATSRLTIQIEDYVHDTLLFELYDVQGKLLSSGQISSTVTDVNINGLRPAIYFIRVVNRENNIIKSFKIVKK